MGLLSVFAIRSRMFGVNTAENSVSRPSSLKSSSFNCGRKRFGANWPSKTSGKGESGSPCRWMRLGDTNRYVRSRNSGVCRSYSTWSPFASAPPH
ncbi:hypothetical protein, partial [Corallococcus exiguus]|uniref:hypothetical protein n=1 Tax=Corallococcus exiguus TaxID=83462 RepID=UPI001C12F76E